MFDLQPLRHTSTLPWTVVPSGMWLELKVA
jgi:hypothetical protein